jgi:hypothetical protein
MPPDANNSSRLPSSAIPCYATILHLGLEVDARRRRQDDHGISLDTPESQRSIGFQPRLPACIRPRGSSPAKVGDLRNWDHFNGTHSSGTIDRLEAHSTLLRRGGFADTFSV